MLTKRAAAITPEQRMAMLDEAVRRVHAAHPDDLRPAALRRALQAEMDRGTTSLVALMKEGRRRVLKNASRKARGAER